MCTKTGCIGKGHKLPGTEQSTKGVQPFGVSGPHWKTKSCLGPHIKYSATCNHKNISSHVKQVCYFCVGPHSEPSRASGGPSAMGWVPLLSRQKGRVKGLRRKGCLRTKREPRLRLGEACARAAAVRRET